MITEGSHDTLNKHIKMISEGSHDPEDWSNG